MKSAPISFTLPPLVIFLSQHYDYLYGFLQDQFLTLARLGYKIFGIESAKDEANKDLFKGITVFNYQNTVFNKEDDISAKTPEIIAQQLLNYAIIYNGGVIFILTSGKIHAKAVCALLTKECARQCEFFADSQHPESESHIRLLYPNASCIRNFWRPIENFLKCDQKTIVYTDTSSLFEARLKRISKAFEIVKDQTGNEHAKLTFNNMSQFDYLSEKIEKKLNITPLLQWSINKDFSNREFAIIVPQLSSAKKATNSSFKTQSEDKNDKFKATINYWLKNSSNKINLNFNGNVKRWVLKLPPGEEISLNEGCIIKMELIEIEINKLSYDFFETNEVNLILFLQNKESILCSLPLGTEISPSTHIANTKALINIRNMLIARGSKSDNSFICQNQREFLNWESVHYKKFYDNEIKRYYLSAHDLIGKYLLDKVPRSQKITLFSFGCANGKELITIKKHFQQNGITVSKLIGFDINSKNFDLNYQSEIQYVQGDLSFLKKLVDATPYDTKTFKVGLFLGLLAFGCMKGTYHALKILQQAREMDTIILCSFTDMLLNKEMLKAAGYQVKEINEERKNSVNFFYLTPMAPAQRRFFLLNRFKNQTYQEIFDSLDLSLSADPYYDLMLFSAASLEYLKEVDISWCYFQREEINPFFKHLAALKKPLDIIISKNQLSFKKIQKALEQYPKLVLIERMDVANQYECPLFDSKKAKTLGTYRKRKI